MGVEQNCIDGFGDGGAKKAPIATTTTRQLSATTELYRPPAARKSQQFHEPQISSELSSKAGIWLPPHTTTTIANNSHHSNQQAINTSINGLCEQNSSFNQFNTSSTTTTTATATTENCVQSDGKTSNNCSSSVGAPTPPTTTTTTTRTRERRPDRAVYVPRARRSQTTPPSPSVPTPQSATAAVPTSTITSPKLPVTNNSVESNSILSSTNFGTITSHRVAENGCLNRTICSCSNNCIANNCLPPVLPKNLLNSYCQSTIAKSDISDCDLFKNKLNGLRTSTAANQTKNQFSIKSSIDDSRVVVCNNLLAKFTATPPATMSALQNKKNLPNLRIEDVGISTKGDNFVKDDKDEKELQRASKEINRSNRRIIKQTFVSDVLEINEPLAGQHSVVENKNSVDPETDDWDTMFDDNGDCLDPKLLDELTASVGKVTIEKPRSDYKLFHSKQAILNAEEFPHVLEISNFPVEFKTQDLMMLFSAYKESGFDIKWVDDTHALAVFSSSKIAAEVLSLNHQFVRLKPLTDATVESRAKAKKCSSSLQPYRQRPETCAALARRLVTGALGVRLKTAREELENERRVLREAKERKLLAAKQRDELWES